MDVLEAIAKSIRSLSIDAIEQAHSGHPGLPLGAAELGSILYAKILRHNPKNPQWLDRDRFVLSAGHGSMLLYSILHIAGYDISIDDIKNFRQLGFPDQDTSGKGNGQAKCPGHPEYGVTPGVEATTGPLGQGIAMAVGMAVAEKMLEARFNTEEFTLFHHYIYALVGEGCLMEGVSNEAASFAGNNKLNNLIVFYDKNQITIDGNINITFTDDLPKRYESYGWHVIETTMYDYNKIEAAVTEAKQQDKPTLIILNSIIGKYSPAQGTSKVHGAPLGAEGVTQVKKELGLDPEKFFYVEPMAYDYFKEKQAEFDAAETEWNAALKRYSEKNPEKYAKFEKLFSERENTERLLNSVQFPAYTADDNLATRAASGKALNAAAKIFQSLVGGSADLETSNCTKLDEEAAFSPADYSGRRTHFGIREFAMAAICNGIYLHGPFRPFCSTFFCFSDYLKPALRLSALMKLPIIYVFSHDSFYVGEDGPTHQPIEMLAMLRSIPNCTVLRPADAEETNEAWKYALTVKDGPVCLVVSRQKLPVLQKPTAHWKELFKKGAYVVHCPNGTPDVTVLATGSETALAVEALQYCKTKKVQIISVPCKQALEQMSAAEVEKLLGCKIGSRRIITCEAGVKMGWEHWCKTKDDCFSIDRFGASGPASDVARYLHFTALDLAALIEK